MFFRLAPLILIVLLIVLAKTVPPIGEGDNQIFDGAPIIIDPAAFYVVMIGASDEAARAVAERDYRVVRQPMPAAEPAPYAAIDVRDTIRLMIKRGIPPWQIAVAGAGRGGRLTLEVSALMHLRSIRYAVFGACPKGGGKIMQRLVDLYSSDMIGRILSLVPSHWTESCHAVFEETSGAGWWERTLEGVDTEVFERPDDIWLDHLDGWIRGVPKYYNR